MGALYVQMLQVSDSVAAMPMTNPVRIWAMKREAERNRVAELLNLALLSPRPLRLCRLSPNDRRMEVGERYKVMWRPESIARVIGQL